MRACQICNSRESELLFTQKFLVTDTEKPFSYNIVSCKKCGFVFAADTPSQKEYDTYYKINSKYSYDSANGILPCGLEKFHCQCFSVIYKFIKDHNGPALDKDGFRVLDIGCSTGDLLYLFKGEGFKNLSGLDPALACGEIGKRLYGVKIVSASLAQYKSVKKYDLIIVSGVLEHLEDIRVNIFKIRTLLKDKGLLFVVVPDAENFSSNPREPFHEFSLEHINFFTTRSLSNLMGAFDLTNVYKKSVHVKHYDSFALLSFWVKERKKISIIKDSKGPSKTRAYIVNSERRLKDLKERIGRLADTKEEIAVWGVGSLTSRLLATTRLKHANIRAFIDSNPNLHGKIINGIKIFSPAYLAGKELTVFISSYVYASQIKKTLLKEYNFKGKIVLA